MVYGSYNRRVKSVKWANLNPFLIPVVISSPKWEMCINHDNHMTRIEPVYTTRIWVYHKSAIIYGPRVIIWIVFNPFDFQIVLNAHEYSK